MFAILAGALGLASIGLVIASGGFLYYVGVFLSRRALRRPERNGEQDSVTADEEPADQAPR